MASRAAGGPCSHAAARSLRGLCSFLLSKKKKTWVVVATSGQALELIRTREGRDEVTGGVGAKEGVARWLCVWAVVCAAITDWTPPGPRRSGNRGPMGKTQGTHGVTSRVQEISMGIFFFWAHRQGSRREKNGPRRKATHIPTQAAGDQLPRNHRAQQQSPPPGTSISSLCCVASCKRHSSADNIILRLSHIPSHSPTFSHRCPKIFICAEVVTGNGRPAAPHLIECCAAKLVRILLLRHDLVERKKGQPARLPPKGNGRASSCPPPGSRRMAERSGLIVNRANRDTGRMPPPVLCPS